MQFAAQEPMAVAQLLRRLEQHVGHVEQQQAVFASERRQLVRPSSLPA